jgi:hypothetical protein
MKEHTGLILLRETMYSGSQQIDISGIGITLGGHSNISQVVAGPSHLQLCAVLGSSGIKLSKYIYRYSMKICKSQQDKLSGLMRYSLQGVQCTVGVNHSCSHRM